MTMVLKKLPLGSQVLLQLYDGIPYTRLRDGTGVNAPLNQRLREERNIVIDSNSHPVFPITGESDSVAESSQPLITGPSEQHSWKVDRVKERSQQILAFF